MWIILRYFGLDGLRARIDEHLELAARFAAWVDAEPDAERLAPVPFATVCFRWHPRGLDDALEPRRLNERLMERLNGTGEVFLSHTRLDGRFTLRSRSATCGPSRGTSSGSGPWCASSRPP